MHPQSAECMLQGSGDRGSGAGVPAGAGQRAGLRIGHEDAGAERPWRHADEQDRQAGAEDVKQCEKQERRDGGDRHAQHHRAVYAQPRPEPDGTHRAQEVEGAQRHGPDAVGRGAVPEHRLYDVRRPGAEAVVGAHDHAGGEGVAQKTGVREQGAEGPPAPARACSVRFLYPPEQADQQDEEDGQEHENAPPAQCVGHVAAQGRRHHGPDHHRHGQDGQHPGQPFLAEGVLQHDPRQREAAGRAQALHAAPGYQGFDVRGEHADHATRAHQQQGGEQRRPPSEAIGQRAVDEHPRSDQEGGQGSGDLDHGAGNPELHFEHRKGREKNGERHRPAHRDERQYEDKHAFGSRQQHAGQPVLDQRPWTGRVVLVEVQGTDRFIQADSAHGFGQ